VEGSVELVRKHSGVGCTLERLHARSDELHPAGINVYLLERDGVRLTAARTLEEMGDEEEAGLRFKALYDDLLEKGRKAEAIDALKQFVRINPLENEARLRV